MPNTNTGENAYLLARTALESSFGIMRVLAVKGLIDDDTYALLCAAAFPDAAVAGKADTEALTHHIKVRLDEIKEKAGL